MKKVFCLTPVVLLLVMAANASAILFDATSKAGSGTTAASTLAWDHTVGTGRRRQQA